MTALLLALLAPAQNVEGFVEGRAQVYAGIDAAVPVLAVQRFRPTFTAPLSDRVQLSTTPELNLTQGWRAPRAAADLAEAYDLAAPLRDQLAAPSADNAVLGVSDDPDYLFVDRLYVDVYTQHGDLRVGRQALNWGSGFVINPSDPFPEVLLTEPWRPRSGVNAAKALIPFGELNNVQLIVATDDAFLHPRLAARATVNALETDWSVVGAWREEADEAIAGLDLKGTLGVGWWVEGVVHLPTDGDPLYEEFVVGLDYSLPVLEQLVVTAQYYRNGSGSDVSGLGALVEDRQPFAPIFSGRDYAMIAASVGVSRDVSGSALWLQNLSDGTAFVVPNVTLLPTGALEVSLAAQLPLRVWGDGGEFKPATQDLIVDLPTEDGRTIPVDFGGVVPSATVILWSRLNF